ncbi:MAG: glycosyltransferase [Actinomycetales bacterium]|nr:MAG: glycosyltransferase [Actinomycetales bacterium]
MAQTTKTPWRRRVPETTMPFIPDYRSTNAYQTLLFSRLESAGITPEPVAVGDLPALLRERAALPDPGVLNVQWTTPLVQRAKDPADAVRRRKKFIGLLDDFLTAGGRLIWTIHNVLPHEVEYREDEILLCRFLADRATYVHVLSAETVDAVADLYPLDPDRVRIIPIASYAGWYPDTVTRDDARARLGLGPDDLVLTTVGGIRPYKGHSSLLDWFEPAAQEDPSLRLLVAGRLSQHEGAEELLRRLDHPAVVARPDFVPDEDLQVWYRAADVAVLPYAAILNSSAFWLAVTFGVPVVAPRLGGLAAFEDLPFVRLFDPEVEGELGRAIASACEDLVDPARPEQWRERIQQHAAEHGPVQMAQAFSDLVAEAARPPRRRRGRRRT